VGYGWASGSIIGSRFNGVVVIDDIHDAENTASERMLKRVKDWFTNTLEFCVMKGAWQIWNFTPWLTNDLYAYIKAMGLYLRAGPRYGQTKGSRHASGARPGAAIGGWWPVLARSVELSALALSTFDRRH
jgi:hypothetical protein